MDYPRAERLDIVDDLFGHAVADPYRWLEDPDSAQTKAWLSEQDAITRPYLDSLPGRERLRERMTELLGTGVIGGPAWRGQRYFFVRRDPGQEHAAVLVREPDGSERTLIDPAALDPSGTTTLDSWQPDKEGRRLAYQLSTGGDEESVLLVLDVDSGEIVDGPIERTRYSPVAWLPGGEAFYYVRRLAAGRGARGRGAVPPPGLPAPAREARRRGRRRVRRGPGQDRLLRRLRQQGRPLADRHPHARHRPSQRRVARRHRRRRARNPCPGRGPGRRRCQTGLHVGNDGRLYVYTDRDAPRGRLCVTDPTDAGVRDLARADPGGPGGGARRLRNP